MQITCHPDPSSAESVDEDGGIPFEIPLITLQTL
jgi:hypothetical protein